MLKRVIVEEFKLIVFIRGSWCRTRVDSPKRSPSKDVKLTVSVARYVGYGPGLNTKL